MRRDLRTIEGRFYRVVPVIGIATVLDGATSREGRYHYPGIRAIYMSPTPAWAIAATETVGESMAPGRTIVQIVVQDAHVVDLRDDTMLRSFGIDGADTSRPWREALIAGARPTSWSVADRVLNAGADGLIDPSRRIKHGWHLVLFRWNQEGRPIVSVAGMSS